MAIITQGYYNGHSVRYKYMFVCTAEKFRSIKQYIVKLRYLFVSVYRCSDSYFFLAASLQVRFVPKTINNTKKIVTRITTKMNGSIPRALHCFDNTLIEALCTDCAS